MNRSQLFAAATALSALGFLTIPTPAQADPMFPLAPPCGQFGFTGGFSLRQDNGFQVSFSANGPAAKGKVVAVGDDNVTKLTGTVKGGIQGRTIDFTIRWDGGGGGSYHGVVGDDGSVRRGSAINQINANSAYWDSTSPLGCLDAPPPPLPPPIPAKKPVPAPDIKLPPAVPAAARLTIDGTGPTTLRAGLGGTYRFIVANNGDVGASAEVLINFAGSLDQTDAVTAEGGFSCGVSRGGGVNATVRCTVQQLAPGPPTAIVVQGRGMTPGAGQLVATINSDAGVQFDNKTKQLNTTVT